MEPIDRHGLRATVGNLVTDMVSADDAAWFEARPGRRFRERPPVQGEFDSPDTTDTKSDVVRDVSTIEAVLVEQVKPGVRIRRPIFPGDTREDVLARTDPKVAEWIRQVLGKDGEPTASDLPATR